MRAQPLSLSEKEVTNKQVELVGLNLWGHIFWDISKRSFYTDTHTYRNKCRYVWTHTLVYILYFRALFTEQEHKQWYLIHNEYT